MSLNTSKNTITLVCMQTLTCILVRTSLLLLQNTNIKIQKIKYKYKQPIALPHLCTYLTVDSRIEENSFIATMKCCTGSFFPLVKRTMTKKLAGWPVLWCSCISFEADFSGKSWVWNIWLKGRGWAWAGPVFWWTLPAVASAVMDKPGNKTPSFDNDL